MSQVQREYGFKYRPEIDGLRAFAVVPVVLYHAGLGLSGGFIGVDVFFVISGYLITGLILKQLSADRFSLVDFWERRLRRILPALSVMVIASLIAGYFLLLPWDYEDLGRSAIMQSVFSANFHFWSQSGYFEGPAELKPLLHTWSLAVEEQFYLLFPGLLLLLWRRFWERPFAILAVIWVLSFALSFYGVFAFPSASFYLLPARAWELLTGALLALRPLGVGGNRSKPFAEVMSLLGLGLILGACFLFNNDTRFPGAAALLPCLGTALFLRANESTLTVTGRLLSLKPFVFIGLISYSWYLWHWPAFAFLNRIYLGELTALASWAVVLGSFLIAILSWRFVERPFRQRNYLNSRRKVFSLAAGVLGIVIGAGLFLDATDGLEGRVPEAVIQLSDQERNPEFRAKHTQADADAGKFFTLGTGHNSPATPTFLLWGDSHAIALAPELDALAADHHYAGYAALRAGKPPILNVWVEQSGRSNTIDYNNAVMRFIEERKIDRVLLAARWSLYVSGKDDEPLKGLILDAEDSRPSLEGARLAFEKRLAETVDQLLELDVEVYIFEQVPDQGFDVPRELADRIWRERSVDELGLGVQAHLARQAPVVQAFSTLPKEVTLLDPAENLIGENGRTILMQGGRSLYIDEDHVSDAGAEFLSPLLEQVFAAP